MNLITLEELVSISILLALGLGVIIYKVLLFYKTQKAREQRLTTERAAREAAYGNMIQELIYDEKGYHDAPHS